MTIAEQRFEEGLAKGREEGRIAALRTILVSRFGSEALDANYEARLQAATATAIDRYLQRVGVAESLAEVFEECTQAEEAAMTIAKQLFEEGFAKGLAKAREERREAGRIDALRTILVSRFGSQALDATYEGRLQVAMPAVIDRYLDRVGVVESLAAVFED